MANLWLREGECDRRGELPEFCMVCGNRTDEYVKRKFLWHPAWTYWMLILGALPAFIAQAVTRQTMQVYVPVCKSHRYHWTIKTAVTLIGGVTILVLFFAIPIAYIESTRQDNGVANAESIGPVMIVTGFISLVLIVLLVLFNRRGVTVLEIDRDEIQFRGVADPFADAVKQDREERKARRKLAREKLTHPRQAMARPISGSRSEERPDQGLGEQPIILD
jgi:hypothetical protein